MSKTYTPIRSLEDLRLASYEKNEDFIIHLNGGVYSRKEIYYYPESKTYDVFHSIDGRIENFTPEKLLTETNIGEAMEKNAFSHVSYD